MIHPSVVLISIDTLRADHLSCYGYFRLTTPNLDRLAEDGVIYENAYSTATWTPPAHASMLTGLYPSQHGVIDNRRLNSSIPTMAETLLRHGYNTVGFVNNSQVGEFVGLHKGHRTFYEVWKGTKSKTIIERTARYFLRKTTEIAGISDHGARKTNLLVKQWLYGNRHRPFYMFIHYIEPHNPLKAPHPHRYKYLKKDNVKINKEKLDLVAHNPLICFTDNIVLNEDEKEALIALYDGEIDYLDSRLGEVIEYLKKNKIYDDTLIIITADHGEHFGEHGLYSHVASLYEPIIHIPLIIKYPGDYKDQNRVSELVQLTDIYPTVLSAIGFDRKVLGNVEGQSLFGRDNKTKYHEYIIAEWEGRIPEYVSRRIKDSNGDPIISLFKEPIAMIREGKYKYILHAHGREELYDLSKDKSEIHNIKEEKKEITERLKQKLIQWQSKNKEMEHAIQSLIDEVTKKNLESLGYM